MKALVCGFLVAGIGLTAYGQYKAPSQYFRKDFPAPVKPGQQQQQQPQQQQQQTPAATPKAAPQKPAQPKFKELPLNTQFYFLSDTNRAHPWTKISAAAAKNVNSGATQAIGAEIPIQR